jgi:hypothetical protein
MVVQLGCGINAKDDQGAAEFTEEESSKPSGGFIVRRTLDSPIPPALLADKLNGFIADHRADTLERDLVHGRMVLQMASRETDGRREVDEKQRTHPFILHVELQWNVRELEQECEATPLPRTRIDVTIRPKRGDDSQGNDFVRKARGALVSLRTYLNAANAPATPVPVDPSPTDS